MNTKSILILISAAVAIVISIVALRTSSTALDRLAETNAFNLGYEAGARFTVRAYGSSNVYLGSLVVSNSGTINMTNCLFLIYPPSFYAIGIDQSNVNVTINGSISVDATHAIIE